MLEASVIGRYVRVKTNYQAKPNQRHVWILRYPIQSESQIIDVSQLRN